MEASRIPHVPTIATVMARLDEISADLRYVAERQRKNEELVAEMMPILKLVMQSATGRLDELEKKGYFGFGRELVKVGERIVEGFSPDDVARLGDAVVSILETVRAMTQPEVLQIAGEASQAIQNVDKTEPMGLVGMIRATRDDDVQKGMAVLMDLMRHVGHAAALIADKRASSPMNDKRAKLAAVTGARKKPKKPMGIERPAAAARAATPKAPEAALGAPSCDPKPRAPQAPAATIGGVAFAADGSLVDPKSWTRELALQIAAAEGVALTDAHWGILEFSRKDFAEHGASPNIRRITQGTGVSTKDLYALFPKAPARTAARIAGLPKPAGCI
jgi:tRNA 2-thiouridine synthesizing protein E